MLKRSPKQPEMTWKDPEQATATVGVQGRNRKVSQTNVSSILTLNKWVQRCCEVWLKLNLAFHREQTSYQLVSSVMVEGDALLRLRQHQPTHCYIIIYLLCFKIVLKDHLCTSTKPSKAEAELDPATGSMTYKIPINVPITGWQSYIPLKLWADMEQPVHAKKKT